MGDFLAFDLGAESGRAIVGRLLGRPEPARGHRFPNEPVQPNGTLQWDILRLWLEVRRGDAASDARLASVGVDAWGSRLRAPRRAWQPAGESCLSRRPDRRHDAGGVRTRQSRRIYATTGIPFLQINTLYQLFAACRATPRLVEAADSLLTIPTS
jgi:rhamnulokinase